MTRILITGATGFLGAHLLKRLADGNSDVVALIRDHVTEPALSTIERYVTVVRGDVTDQRALERILAEYETETVFHLAAQSQVGTGAVAPTSTLETNIKGTWSVLEAARRIGKCKRIVVASSDKAYGNAAKLPYTESMPLAGSYPYDVSKSCADLIAQSYVRTYELPVVVVRCSNIYGPGDLNWNRLIPAAIRALLSKSKPVLRGDGFMKRDYLYIDDAVAGYIAAARYAGESVAFNLGTGIPLTAREVVMEITEAMGLNVKPEIEETASREIDHQWMDVALARRELKWAPNVGFRDGIARTIAWYRAWLQKRGLAV